MKLTPTQTLTATGTTAPATHAPNQSGIPDAQAVVTFGGAFTGATGNVDVQQQGSTQWTPAAMTNRKTLAVGSGSAALTDSTATSFFVDVRGCTALRAYPSAGSALTMTVDIVSGSAAEMGGPVATISNPATAPAAALTFEANTALTTVGAGTITAASISGGAVTRTGPTSAFSDTTGTAADLIAARPSSQVGQSWEFNYTNQTAFVGTLIGGSNVTVTMASGTLLVAPNSWVRFLCTQATASTVTMVEVASGPNTVLPPAKFTTINVTTGTLAAGNASGAAFTSLMSTNATPGNQAMRTVAQVLADTPGLLVGQSYILEITQTGAGTLTLTTDSGTQFTMTGTMTVPQNTTRKFVVTINTATTGTVQAVGVGTYS